MATHAKSFEVHQHTFVRGSRAGHLKLSRVEHSHEGGDVPHEHPDMGPATFTIDRTEWGRKTGLRGGGKKVFTLKPTGEQFEYVAVETPTFELYISQPLPDGAVLPAAERMIQQFGMKPIIRGEG